MNQNQKYKLNSNDLEIIEWESVLEVVLDGKANACLCVCKQAEKWLNKNLPNPTMFVL